MMPNNVLASLHWHSRSQRIENALHDWFQLSWVALVCSWGMLGGSWGALGPSWAALGLLAVLDDQRAFYDKVFLARGQDFGGLG